MGITRHPTRVRLSTRTATESDRIAPAGMTLWVVAYTVTQNGRESSFVTDHVAEAAARRMVANLLADRLPGFSVEDVYSEDVG
ncbi:hypothetical protein [Mycobacteroides abscessus]|uniref:hypothetical protein n=1 Tax=Mycobacteroides abscessus TaxID=36809 RepID=UPI0019D0AD16|nr:hypothetical protein [Mycobacteroides abscessus]MBN7296593.1 hypothetical protein [Mycobacteroides abscessus subsp. abscessus]